MYKSQVGRWLLTALSLALIFTGCTMPTPPQTALPTISAFSVEPDTITEGESATLSWTVANANTVRIVVNNVVIHESSELSGTLRVTPLATTEYHLVALRGTRSVKEAVTLSVTPAPVPLRIESFTAIPASLPAGGGTTQLSWAVTGASGIVIAAVGGDVVYTGEAASNAIEVDLTDTTTFKLTATAENGVTAEKDVTVSVTLPAPTIDSFSASPDSLPVGGGTTTLSWVVSNADTVLIAVVGGSSIYNGSILAHSVATSVPVTMTFRLTASSSVGSVERDVIVTVDAPPPPVIVTLQATPSNLPYGGGTTDISWTVTGATSVQLSPVGGSPVYSGAELTHSVDVPVSVTATYRLVATSPVGSVNADVTVTVAPPPPPPVITAFTVTPASLPYTGGDVSVSWNVTGASNIVVQVVGGSTLYDGSAAASSVTHTVTADTTYSITATNAGGSVSDTASVTVAAPPAAVMQDLSATVISGSRLQIVWHATDATSFDVYAVSSDDTPSLLSGNATSPLTVPIPASTNQIIRVVAHGPGGDDSDQVVPANVVVSAADYDQYYLLDYSPETPIPGTLRQVLADAVPGSVVGFASDITEIALEGVDLQSTAGGTVDAHLILRKDVTVSGPTSRVTLRGSYNMDLPGIVDPFTYESRLIWIGPGRQIVLENLNLRDGTFIFKGAGIFNGGTLTVRDTDILDSRAWEGGGGIWNSATGNLRLERVVLSGNEAAVLDTEDGNPLVIRDQVLAGQWFNLQGYGGALFNDGGTVYMEDTTVSSNRSRFSGGAIYSNGGSLEIVASTVTGNSSNYAYYTPGGNQPGFGGGIVLTNAAALTLASVTLSGNFAQREGGALYMDAGTSVIHSGVAMNNNSADYGGGISQKYNQAVGELDRTGMTFIGNTATSAGPDYYGVCLDCLPAAGATRNGTLDLSSPGLYTPSTDGSRFR
mgnify:CR=1 FL=1